jgi:hypothetical protein
VSHGSTEAEARVAVARNVTHLNHGKVHSFVLLFDENAVCAAVWPFEPLTIVGRESRHSLAG